MKKGPKLSEFGYIEFSSPTKKEKARYHVGKDIASYMSRI